MTSERTYYGLTVNGERVSGESLFASLDDARQAIRDRQLDSAAILAITTDADDNVLRSRIVETAL